MVCYKKVYLGYCDHNFVLGTSNKEKTQVPSHHLEISCNCNIITFSLVVTVDTGDEEDSVVVVDLQWWVDACKFYCIVLEFANFSSASDDVRLGNSTKPVRKIRR